MPIEEVERPLLEVAMNQEKKHETDHQASGKYNYSQWRGF
jgi:hypothetical protein